MYNNARITRRGSHIQGRRVRSLAGRFRTLKTTTIKQMMTYYFFPLFLQRYVFHHLSPPRLLSRSLPLSPLSLYHPYFIQPNCILYTLAPIYYTLQHSAIPYAARTPLSCFVVEIVFCTLLHCDFSVHAVVHLCDVTYYIYGE